MVRRAKDPDAWNRKRNEMYRNARLALFEALGGKCVRCGIDDERVLHADHIVPLARTGEKRKSGVSGVYYALKHLELFQLLCANCHMIKTWEDRVSNPE